MCDNNWLGSSWSGDQGMEGSVTGFVPVTFSYNVSAGDATNAKISAEYVYNNIIPAAFQYDRPVILMHERSPYTRAALPRIIEALKEKGYSFGQVKDLSETVQHRTPAYAAKVLAE